MATTQITALDLAHYVGNAFALVTSEVADALFDGDTSKALAALHATHGLYGDYVNGEERDRDGKYNELVWQVYEDVQGWSRDEAREYLLARNQNPSVVVYEKETEEETVEETPAAPAAKTPAETLLDVADADVMKSAARVVDALRETIRRATQEIAEFEKLAKDGLNARVAVDPENLAENLANGVRTAASRYSEATGYARAARNAYSMEFEAANRAQEAEREALVPAAAADEKDAPPKLSKVQAGWYASEDGCWAVVSEGQGYADAQDRAYGDGNDGWALVYDRAGGLRKNHNDGENLGWFDTKRDALDALPREYERR
jgi:hypothetical protein